MITNVLQLKNQPPTQGRTSIFKYLSLLAMVLFFGLNGVKGQTYSQITTLVGLVDGDYLIVGDGATNDGIMLNTVDATPYINRTTVTNPGSSITSGFTSANVFQITVVSGDITIYNSSVGYVSWGRTGNTGNTANFFSGTVANSERWTPTVSSGLWTLTNVGTTARSLQWNNSNPRFACYTSTQVRLKLYKLATTAPLAPTIGTITPGNQQLSVAFTAGSDGGSAITTYKYSTDGGATFLTRQTGTTASPIIITTLSSDGTTPLTNGASYNVQIRAVNAIGDGTATASTAATPYTTPSAPTINSVTAGNTQLSVDFTANATGGSAITNYQYSTDGGATFLNRQTGTTGSPIVITTLSSNGSTSLTNGVTYDVQIKAVNAAGAGTASSTVQGTPVAPVSPTLTVLGSLSAVNTTYGTASASPTSFTVSGASLTNDIVITPPSGFEVSTSIGSGYTTSLTLTQSGGSVSTTTVYLRLAATTGFGTYSGNIDVTSTGAVTQSVATASSSVAKKALTITGITVDNKIYDGTTTATTSGTAVYSGLVNSESFTVTDIVSFAFATASVGNGKTINQTGTYTAPSVNYSISQPTLTANITTATPPTITPALGTTVDGSFNVTFVDDALWRSGITGITVGGTTLTAGYTVSSGQIAFNPAASVPTGLLQTAGSKTIVVSSTGYSSNTFTQAIGVGATTKLTNNTAPAAPATNGVVLATQPKVNITDQYGNIITTDNSTVVTVAATQGTWTLGGTLTATAVNGVASFSGLTATSATAITGASLDYTATGLAGFTSATFNIPAPAPANDLCASAITLTVGAGSTGGSMDGATMSSPFNDDNDVWFKFTATCTGTATVTISTTSQDIDLTAWSTSCPAATTGNIGTGGGTSSLTTETLTISATQGTTYFVRVIHYAATSGSVAGSFNIAVTSSVNSTLALANTGTPAAGNISNGTSNVTLFGFSLTPSACNNISISSVSITTAGTATSSDLSNFRLLYDANSNGTADAGEISSPIGTVASLSNPLVFSSLAGQSFSPSTVRRYLLIADVAASPTDGVTFTGSLSNTNVTSTATASSSATGNAQTVIIPTVPLVPTINSITGGTNQLSVAFTAGANGGASITTYKYSTDGGATFRTRASGSTASPLVITTLSSDGTTPLVNGVTYDVQIRAVNSVGDGVASSTTQGTPVLTNTTAKLWNSAAGSAWLTSGNWNGGLPSSTEVAQFGGNPTPGTSVNINGGTTAISAIEVTNSRILNLTIGNNSGGATNGTLTLNGGVVNSIENIIIRNNSANLLTLQNTGSSGSGSNTMSLALGNSTNNIISIEGNGGITISSIISGSSRNLTKIGAGAGVLTLTGANTYSGITTVSAGTLRLNRSGGTTIPNTNNVVIDGGTLQVSSNQTLNDLTLTSGTLIIDAGVTLTINGTITRTSGVIRGSSTSNLVITGTSGTIAFDQTTPGTTNLLRNLTISGSGTTTLGNALNIVGGSSAGIVTVGSGATLAAGNNLTLKSDANGTGSIASNNSGLTYITGNVTVERFVSGAGRRWRFLSSPVQSATVANWMTYFYVTGPGDGVTLGVPMSTGWHASKANIDFPNSTFGSDPRSVKTTSIRTYNESASGNNTNINAGWENLSGTNQALTPGQGFRVFVRGAIGTTGQLDGSVTSQSSVILALTGAVNQGDVSPTITNNTQGWNLIGNPYPCAYNLKAQYDAAQTSNMNNIDVNYYVFDPNTNGYKGYNPAASSGAGAGTLTSGIIPSGTAFFIQATGTPTFVFKETFKTTSAPIALHKSASNSEFSIKYFKDSAESDEYILSMMGTATLNKDRYDISKLRNDNLNLSSYGEDTLQLMLSSIPLVDGETRIKLNVEATQVGTYKFEFKNIENFDAGVSVSLLDKYTNKTTSIKANTVYSFEMGAGENQWGKNRFELILNGKATGVNNTNAAEQVAQMLVYPNPATDVLNIDINNANFKNSEIVIYNISGTEVLRSNMASNSAQLNIETLSAGVYFVKVSNQNGFNKTVKFVK